MAATDMARQQDVDTSHHSSTPIPTRCDVSPPSVQMPERLRETLENLIVGCQILDHELRYVYVNASAAMHGRKRKDELIGLKMVEVYPGIEKTEVYRRILACLTTGSPERLDNEFRFADGTLGIFELSMQAVPEGVLIASVDVTQERELALRLVQAQKLEAVGRLAGGVAHDFNNLLTVIKGHCDLLQAGIGPEQQGESINAIRAAGQRAARLTRQLLSISKHAKVSAEVIDLNEHLDKSRDFIRSLLGESIQLELLLHDNVSRVRTDPGQFEQTVMNLVLNARDAMPEGGRLQIELDNYGKAGHTAHLVPEMLPGNYVYMRVSDNGTGMSAEVRERIFEPFFTTKEVGRGTGLGLAVVHSAMQQTNGYIAVTSSLNEGSTFHLFYPACVGPRTAPHSDGVQMVSTKLNRILLVEDEDSVRKIVRLSLEKQGCQVIECACPELALAIIDSQRPIDLLVTDVVMPNMRGPDLARALRQSLPELKVLYMSGYADESIGLKNALRPCDDFLQKPFSPSELVLRVRKLLSQS